MSLRRSTRTVVKPASVSTIATKTPTQGKKRTAEVVKHTETVKRSRNGTAVVQEDSEQAFKKPEVPVTPIRKQRSSAKKVPPLTPTPSLINVIRAPYSSGDVDDATPPPIDRPVEPHLSNATLVTPGGTRSTAYKTNGIAESPSRSGLPRPIATTGNVLEKACAHLIEVDSRMRPLVEQHRCAIFSPEGLAEEIDPFRSLTSSIMGQQVSGAAAKAIKNRFIALFNDEDCSNPIFPTPTQVAATDVLRLKSAGLSLRKAEYIQGLAEKFASGEFTNGMLMTASDDELMDKLITVRGLGKWSVEMFACFALKRLDIFSTGDLGVQRGMAHFAGRDIKKLKAKQGGGKWKYMSEQEMLDMSAPFAPYRSLFMWYMWRVEDVDIDVMNSN